MAYPLRDKSIYGRYASDPIVLDWIAGMSQAEISLKYNKTVKAIDSYLRRRRVNHGKSLDLDLDQVLSYVKDGKTWDEIASILNVDRGHINKLLRRNNINANWQELRAEGASGKKLIVQDVINLYKDNGLSISHIANLYGYVGYEKIRKILIDNGIQLRTDGIHQLKTDDKFATRTQLDNKEYISNLYVDKGMTADAIADVIGVSQYAVLSAIHKHNIQVKNAIEYSTCGTMGSYHEEVIKFLDSQNIQHKSCFTLRTRWDGKDRCWELDEYLTDRKLFIEVQGEFWHGISTNSWKYQHVRQKMWSDLWKYLAIRRDLPDHRMVYLTNKDTNIDKLKKILKLNTTEYTQTFDKKSVLVSMVDSNTANEFLDAYHYLGRAIGTYYGIVYNSKLTAVVVISSPTRQGTKSSIGACREITRICRCDDCPTNLLSYGISKIFKLEKKIGTKAIVTFADPTPYRKDQHTGSIYKALNFTMVGETAWNYCYTDDKCNIIHKKTIYNRAKKLHMKEREYVEANGLYKLPEWPKLKFELIL